MHSQVISVPWRLHVCPRRSPRALEDPLSLDPLRLCLREEKHDHKLSPTLPPSSLSILERSAVEHGEGKNLRVKTARSGEPFLLHNVLRSNNGPAARPVLSLAPFRLCCDFRKATRLKFPDVKRQSRIHVF